MKKDFLFFAVSLLSTSLLFGCKTNNVSVNTSLTELPTPVITKYENNTVFWDSVSNCDCYIVKINKTEYNVDILQYTPSFTTSCAFSFTMKAKGKNSYSSDSPWTETKNYNFIVDNGQGSSVSLKTKLSVPTGISLNGNEMEWNAVDGAKGYQVSVNDVEDETASTSYKLNFGEDTTFRFKIKTLSSDNAKYDDSDWSANGNYEYKKTTSLGWDEENKAVTNGIGRTVNAIDGEYIQTSSGGDSSSIFDMTKLHNLPLLEQELGEDVTSQSSGSTFEKYYNEFYNSVSKKVEKGAGITACAEGIFSLGLSGKFSSEMNSALTQSRSEITKEYYYSYNQIYSGKKVFIDGYNNIEKFRNILTDTFKNEAKQVGNKEISAEKFFNDFGTHFLAGGVFGGSIEATYSVVSNSNSFSQEVLSGFGTSIGLGVSGVVATSEGTVGGSANISDSLASITKNIHEYGASSLASIFQIKSHGGTYVISCANFDDFFSEIKAWSSTIQDNMVLIDALGENDGGSLIALWDILPTTDDFSQAKEVLSSYFKTKCSESYASVLKKFSKSATLGSDDNPYKISTCQDLATMLLSKDGQDIHFILLNDIDFADGQIQLVWTPISNFKGILDGHGKHIKNLKVIGTSELDGSNIYSGLIYVNHGSIKNISFDNVSISAEHAEDTGERRTLMAGIVGYNCGLMENIQINNAAIKAMCSFKNDECNKGSHLSVDAGAICGTNKGTINYCSVSKTSMRGYTNAKHNTSDDCVMIGGICGTNCGSILNCISFDGNLYSCSTGGYYQLFKGGGKLKDWSGYLIGNNESSCSKCVVYGNKPGSNVTDTHPCTDKGMDIEEYPGLATGKNSGTFTNVYCMANSLNFLGSGSSNYSKYVYTNITDIVAICSLWEHWSYSNGILSFSF